MNSSFLSLTQSDKRERVIITGTSSRRITNIYVFYGSDSGNSPKFVEAAQELERVVYGCSNLALMGVVSKSVKKWYSQVLGTIPKPFDNEIFIGKTNEEKYIILGISERFTKIINHVNAFIALLGGLGTLDDIITVAS